MKNSTQQKYSSLPLDLTDTNDHCHTLLQGQQSGENLHVTVGMYDKWFMLKTASQSIVGKRRNVIENKA